MNMENNCILKLNHLLFDEITFNRVNFKSKNDLQVEFGFSFNKREYGEFVSSIRIIGTKKDEYNFVVRASGYFQISEAVEDSDILIQQNAIAIVFPYIRSQISLLTAQPEVDPVILPPMNIAQMVKESIENQHKTESSTTN
jgi:preprotein translocase subunit secB